ncbi:MAG TPA: hypothetical protein VMG63_14065, partial [Terriglobia bacterium]|nr:hypothetical protein [Terriglobia bacterium]
NSADSTLTVWQSLCNISATWYADNEGVVGQREPGGALAGGANVASREGAEFERFVSESNLCLEAGGLTPRLPVPGHLNPPPRWQHGSASSGQARHYLNPYLIHKRGHHED